MPKFSKASILKAAKMSLTMAERKKNAELQLALSAAVEDMAMRLYGASIVAHTTEDMSAATREVALRGDNDDLDHILFLVISTSDATYVIDYKPRDYFLRSLNDPDARAGIPDYYTVLTDDGDGYPYIKFDKPLDEDYTLDVYYFPEGSPENISRFRNPICLIHGTLGYFFGTETEKGSIAYSRFEKLVGIARAADKYPAHRSRKFDSCPAEKFLRDTRNEVRFRRS